VITDALVTLTKTMPTYLTCFLVRVEECRRTQIDLEQLDTNMAVGDDLEEERMDTTDSFSSINVIILLIHVFYDAYSSLTMAFKIVQCSSSVCT